MIENNNDFEKIALDLRFHTATLENLQGQLFDGSYRRGSLMVFRAMVIKKDLETDFDDTKFQEFKEKVGEISVFIDEIINSPTIFGSYLQ